VKKFAAIFFFIIYAATAFGVVVNFHYCDRALNHVSITPLNNKCDRNSNSLMPVGCCRDKSICLKVDSRILTQQPFIPKPVFHQTDLFPVSNPVQIFLISDNYISTLHYKQPPQILPKRIYLFDRVFRI